jgi:hypothetical protein
VISSTSPLSPKHLLGVSLRVREGECYWAKCQFGVVCSSLTMLLCAWPSPHRVRSCYRGKQAATVDGREGCVYVSVLACGVCVRVMCQRGIPINRVESKGNNPPGRRVDAVSGATQSTEANGQCPVSRARCLCCCLRGFCGCGDGCACGRVSDSVE